MGDNLDYSEEIVRAWLETQGYTVMSRLKYKIEKKRKDGQKVVGWSDVDLIGIRPKDGKRVVVDVTAWMTENITLSYVENRKGSNYYRLFKSTFPLARKAIRNYFNVTSDDDYKMWLVVSFISERQRNKVIEIIKQYFNEVFEFRDILRDIIVHVKENPNLPKENETLQTIRALILCGFLENYDQ